MISSALTNNAVTFATYSFTPTSAGAPQYPNVVRGAADRRGHRCRRFSTSRPTSSGREIEMARSHPRARCSAGTSTVSASYLYSRGSHLPTFVDTNLPQPNRDGRVRRRTAQSRGTFPFFRGARPDTRISNAIEVADIVESTYHALVLQANRRFSKGLLFNANYTLSKSEDTGQNSTTFISNFSTLVNPFDVAGEAGPSSFDRRHRVRRRASTTRRTTSGASRSAAPARSRAACRSTRRSRSTRAR